MRQFGEIISIDGNLAQVKVVQHSACSTCSHKCGLAHDMKDIFVSAENQINAQVGESIVLELNHRLVLKAAFVIYTFPLLFLLLGLVFGVVVLDSEPLALVCGLSLLILSYLFIRFVLEPRFKAREQYRMVIVGQADNLDCLGRNS